MNTTQQRSIRETWKVRFSPQGPARTGGFVLPAADLSRFDPFLLMGDETFREGAFDDHPHRGMETVTFVLDGELRHRDNKGGHGRLRTGDAQWMTAGSGLIHNEVPAEGTSARVLQLWVNLPKERKMVAPRYQDIPGDSVPLRREEGVTYRVYSGRSGEAVSPTKNHVPVTLVDIRAEAGAQGVQELPAGYRGFLYVLEGSGTFGSGETPAAAGEVLLLDDAGDAASELRFRAATGLRMLLVAGRPLHEPIAARGPFVMNTEEELAQAYADYRSGRF